MIDPKLSVVDTIDRNLVNFNVPIKVEAGQAPVASFASMTAVAPLAVTAAVHVNGCQWWQNVDGPFENKEDRLYRTKKGLCRPLIYYNRTQPRYRNMVNGISCGDIRRLARRAGVKKMAADVYEDGRYALKGFLQKAISKAYMYSVHDQRCTISALDVSRALKSMGITLYGYGG